jgi:DNA-binding phage protein
MTGDSKLETSKFRSADYLKTPAAIAAYLTEAFETDDAAYIHSALETIGLSGASKLEFETIRKLMKSLGVKLVAEPIEGKRKSP